MKQLRYYSVIVLLLFFSSCVQMNKQDDDQPDNSLARETDKQSESNVTENSERNFLLSVKAFIPENYSVLDTTNGDVNLDNIPDLLLVLRKNGEDTSSNVVDHPEKRPLIILLRDTENKFTQAARNDNTVLCFDCGGILGDPFTDITITNGQFSIQHNGGSNWRWNRMLTYQYSKPENQWFLVEDKTENYHSADPEKVENNIKTGKDFGKLRFEDFDIYKDQ